MDEALAGGWSRCCSPGVCLLKAVWSRRNRAMEGENGASEDFLDSSLEMEVVEPCAVLVFGGGKACVGSCAPGRYDKHEHTRDKRSNEMFL